MDTSRTPAYLIRFHNRDQIIFVLGMSRVSTVAYRLYIASV